MKANKAIFYFPVDPKAVPGYYNVIEKPICLKQVEDRIRLRQYRTVMDFYDDVHLVWANCKQFNVRPHSVYVGCMCVLVGRALTSGWGWARPFHHVHSSAFPSLCFLAFY